MNMDTGRGQRRTPRGPQRLIAALAASVLLHASAVVAADADADVAEDTTATAATHLPDNASASDAPSKSESLLPSSVAASRPGPVARSDNADTAEQTAIVRIVQPDTEVAARPDKPPIELDLEFTEHPLQEVVETVDELNGLPLIRFTDDERRCLYFGVNMDGTLGVHGTL